MLINFHGYSLHDQILPKKNYVMKGDGDSQPEHLRWSWTELNLPSRAAPPRRTSFWEMAKYINVCSSTDFISVPSFEPICYFAFSILDFIKELIMGRDATRYSRPLVAILTTKGQFQNQKSFCTCMCFVCAWPSTVSWPVLPDSQFWTIKTLLFFI